jgi:hypothetical protein
MTFRPLVGVVWGVLLGVAGCSSPTTPSAPTAPSPSLAVAGTAILTIGQITQFTAKTSTGQTVTAQAVWQSSNTAVATVSPTGLVTPTGIGTAAITATYSGATGTLAISVMNATTPAPSPPTITSCGIIVTPGSYVVASDISGAPSAGTCLSIQASDVQLDCRNHTVSSLGFTTVHRVTAMNCTVTDPIFVDSPLTNVTIAHNTLVGGWNSITSQQLTLMANHISGRGVILVNASSSVVTNNTVDNATSQTFYAVDLVGGTNNQVLQNTINGGYGGTIPNVGLDDGIILSNETSDTIQGNTISNVFDAGIEGVDIVQNTTIAQNTITNAGFAGIGSYWCTQWTGNVISGNTVSLSPTMMYVVYAVGKGQCGSPVPAGGFTNNQVTGNRLVNPPALGQDVYGISIALANLNVAAVSNNLIQGNDLGSGFTLVLTPASGFINGGGNTCDPSSNPFCGGLVADYGVTHGSSLIGPAVWQPPIPFQLERAQRRTRLR